MANNYLIRMAQLKVGGNPPSFLFKKLKRRSLTAGTTLGQMCWHRCPGCLCCIPQGSPWCRMDASARGRLLYIQYKLADLSNAIAHAWLLWIPWTTVSPITFAMLPTCTWPSSTPVPSLVCATRSTAKSGDGDFFCFTNRYPDYLMELSFPGN